ncbi:hypothetical protein [Actinacidiphila bryophytorum]|uniref:Exonuclease SbcC n=1 Tax=Actinacidiphila bryophytorum TaxID=1436133 RepID=A0A9W4H5R3_9ACTN|nr:hypothetical protein [Actinacidiphila bryophytorum]MBM9439625.1 hypothetical protein [Actinacidiphila bryophytorum]MBN6543761.1 hypothetical protein [Actinacidiphila bryophytorum]CAG7653261.1 Exonuclease SbcC [Actinacidiphila bryophytorum]
MSGRAWHAAGVTVGALLLAVGCTFGGGPKDPPRAAEPTEAPGPPVGSVEHPRPVDCLDGATTAPGHPGDSTATAGRPWSPPGSSSPRARGDDVTVGPLTLEGLHGLVRGDQEAHGVHNSDGWHYLVGASVRLGGSATVTIGAEQRARAGLEFGGGDHMGPAPAVTFSACADAATSFLGAFFVAGDGKACVPLDIRVGDSAPRRVVISFFDGECAA